MTLKTENDTEIRRNVLSELRRDPAINETDIGVDVKDVIVTLSGTVNSYVKKVAIERAILRVDGVRGVAEDIEVSLYTPGVSVDTEIAAAALKAIDSDTSIPSERIKVRVENGRVTLTVSLDHSYERARAKSLVRQLAGVIKIRNEIAVTQPPVVAGDVRSQIRDTFTEHAVLDASRLRIEVDASIVTLSGSVDSHAEKEFAEAAAWRANGVKDVVNNIVVAETD